MKLLVETHILQNFAPANLNRDDTGSPKDAYFGGYRRGRVSSQSLKRAIRKYFDEEGLVPKENLGDRTKRVVEALAVALEPLGHQGEEARTLAGNALRAMGSQKKFNLKATKHEEREQSEILTDYLVFLARREARELARIIHEHADVLSAKKPKIDKELRHVLEAALNGGRAVDIALFGRMLANLPERNQDAACQVAHAIGTHAVEREFDFYTAVDDFRPGDTSGADMMGTIEFNSSCFYRYAVIDVAKLVENLGEGDEELALLAVEAFLRGSVFALPTGKQNTFAAHNPPSFAAFVVRQNASPRSLANAFAAPVDPRREGGDLVAASVSRLADHWGMLERAYGQGGTAQYLDLTEAALPSGLAAARMETLDALIGGTVGALRAALER